MAIQGIDLSSTPVLDDYEAPYNQYTGPLEDFEAGGIALNDGTVGLDYQIWYLSYNDDDQSENYGDFTVKGLTTGEESVVLNVPEVTRVGLAFDQNMNPFIAYETRTCGAAFYWYDTLIADYQTTVLGTGSKYVACCLDDHRQTQTGTSDIILGYMRGGSLRARLQRDRYTVEYELVTDLGAAELRKVGMAQNLRVKWEVVEGGASTRLSEIVGDLCARVGVKGDMIDVGALYPIEVRGYKSAGLYNAADSIRTLQQLYFFDFPMIDGRLTAVRRGGVPVATITQNDLVTDREFRFESAREQGVEFPLKLHVGYASAESDYTPTKVTSERRSRDIKSRREDAIESAVNHTAQDAAERVDIMHRMAWAALEGKGKFSLPESFAYLVPSDLVYFETRPDTYKVLRLTRVVRVDGVLDCEAERDRQSSYASGTIVLPDSTSPGTSNPSIGVPTPVDPEPPLAAIPGETTWEFMDLPALITAHDTLHYYVAGHGGSGTAWHGAQVQQQVGSDFQKVGDIPSAELMGTVAEALPASASEFIDTTNTMLLDLNGTPESTTLDLMFAGKGAWLIGDEIIQVKTWVAEGDNWRGSTLIRGRLDTTPASHAIGVRAVFLGNPSRIQVDGALLDTSLQLRAPPYGSVPSDSADAAYSFTGRSQEEWPPEMLTAVQDGSDWDLSWIPRYRLGNSANPIPSANFYGWQITFTVGPTSVTKIINSTTPAYIYTSAAQSADFGSAQSSFDDVEIRALNYLGGPGKALSEAVS